MQRKDYLYSFISKLSEKIQKSQNQWKGKRFASNNDSDSSGTEQDDDFGEYEEYMEKYRGKNGDLKPLGLLLYQKYVRNLIGLFFILTLLSLPLIIIYSLGGGLTQFQTNVSFSKSILLFSIANLHHYRFDNLSQQNLNKIQFQRSLTIFIDIICIFTILGFILYWKVISTNVVNHYAAKSPSPHLYCLEVSNIERKKQHQIQQHFRKFGKIAQISYVRTHKQLLIELMRIVKLVTQYRHAQNNTIKQKQITEKIQTKYAQLQQIYQKNQKPYIKQCFICYDQIKVRNRVADLYRYKIMPEKLQFDNGNNCSYTQQFLKNKSEISIQKQQQKQPNFIPIVKKCKFEPLTFNQQNCDINKVSQIIKFSFQGVLLTLMVFMILIALFLLNINSTHVKEQFRNNPADSGTQTINSQQRDSMFHQIIKNKNNQQIVYTFCASLTYSTFKWQYYDLCYKYFNTERNRFVLMLMFSLLVAVINLLTNRILWALVAFRRYRTLAERNQFLITSIFMFSLINSAILILFIRQQHIGPILRSIVAAIFGFNQEAMRVTVYPEFNRQWFMNIGGQLMMNYVISLIIFPHFHIFLHWIRKKYRQIMAKRKGKLILDPNFNYCTFYALSLKAIFFAMLYSNCMPFFYFFCLIGLVVQLYIGKFLLKKFVQEPVFVDNNSIQVAVNLIPYSLLLHSVMSILFYGVDEIFPEQDSYFNMQLSLIDRNIRRIQRSSIYIIVIILISLFIWNRQRIYKIVVKYWLGRDSSKIQCDLNMKFNVVKNNPAFLGSYKMRDNPKYKILYYADILFQNHMQKIRKSKKQQVTLTEEMDSEFQQSYSRNQTTLRSNYSDLQENDFIQRLRKVSEGHSENGQHVNFEQTQHSDIQETIVQQQEMQSYMRFKQQKQKKDDCNQDTEQILDKQSKGVKQLITSSQNFRKKIAQVSI